VAERRGALNGEIEVELTPAGEHHGYRRGEFTDELTGLPEAPRPLQSFPDDCSADSDRRPDMNTFERAAALADIPSGTMRGVTIRGCEVLIANVDGEVLATDDTCTHEDASLSCGVLDGAIVRCPLHGATFDLRDGAPLEEPAEEPLRCHEVRVEDGAVFVRLRGE